MDSDPDEAVPKLPRGRGLKFSGPEMFRVLMTLMTLVGLVLLARPCANAVSGFVMGMDGSAAKAMPKPGNVEQPQQYEQLKPDMTEAELKAAIARAKARNAESDHSGTANTANAGGGSAAGIAGSASRAGSAGSAGTGSSSQR